MTLDILLSSLHAAQPLSRILCHQLNEQMNDSFRQIKQRECVSPYPFANILGLFTQRLGVGDRVVSDGGKQFILIIPVKWRLPHQHLIQEDTIGPPGHTIERPDLQNILNLISPVHTLAIRLVVDNLRSNVVRCPAKCLELLKG